MSIFKRFFGKSEKKVKQNFTSENIQDIEKKAMEELKTLPQKDQDLFLEMLNKISGNPIIESNTPQLFKEEIYDSIRRYYSAPEYRIEFDLQDEKGNTFQEHEAFDYTFSEWKKIHSVWDRRSILFEQWDETEFINLQKWQIIERFVKDRYSLKAVEFQKKNITNEDFQDIRLIVSLSKLYRTLNSNSDAINYAKNAFELRPDLDIVKIEYANVLHLSDSQEDKELSHRLINEIIENKTKTETDKKEIGLLNYFLFSIGYIDSSIFAIVFLNVGKADLETWQKIAEEYYWCPTFRFEHSVFLSKNGESLQALAKLISLADEFPWYKHGVLASIEAINQLRVKNNDPTFMTEEMNKMEQYKSMWKA
jgi:mRNA-degrading endonuclease RelE of RelBE toxin-antitoxin system